MQSYCAYLDVSGFSDFLEGQLVSVVEVDEDEGLEVTDPEFLGSSLEPGTKNTHPKVGLPLEFAASVFTQVKLLE